MTLSIEEFNEEFGSMLEGGGLSARFMRHTFLEKYPNTMIHLLREIDVDDPGERYTIGAYFDEKKATSQAYPNGPVECYTLHGTVFQLEDGTLADGNPPQPFGDAGKIVIYDFLSKEFLYYMRHDPLKMISYMNIPIRMG